MFSAHTVGANVEDRRIPPGETFISVVTGGRKKDQQKKDGHEIDDIEPSSESAFVINDANDFILRFLDEARRAPSRTQKHLRKKKAESME